MNISDYKGETANSKKNLNWYNEKVLANSANENLPQHQYSSNEQCCSLISTFY